VDKDTAELIAFSNRQITRHHAGDQW
jgi:hypothetical protein